MTITVISERETLLESEITELKAERAELEHKLQLLQLDSDLIRTGARLVHEKLRRENKELEKKNDALKAECEDHIQQLRKEQLEVQRLHHELAALQNQEPAQYRYLFSNPFGGQVWRDSANEWNGNRPIKAEALYLSAGAKEKTD